MIGGYRKGLEDMPRVLYISIARYKPTLPEPGEELQFLISIHEEGTGITWQQNVTLPQAIEARLLDLTQELYHWSTGAALDSKKAQRKSEELGELLYKYFIGTDGNKYLKPIAPTAILLNVDETILNLPWELIKKPEGEFLALSSPFGRVVTTRLMPKPGRDPKDKDNTLRILIVANPTLDLPDLKEEAKAIYDLRQKRWSGENKCEITIDRLYGSKATLDNFIHRIQTNDYDILHFIGHGYFFDRKPEEQALQFAGGTVLKADDILNLKWKDAPPYFVFANACEAGRVGQGKRLVFGEGHGNGLAAAFLSIGVYAYVGYYWPVSVAGAKDFAVTFYNELISSVNVGAAFHKAREEAYKKYEAGADLTAFGAILYGDSASKYRRDIFIAE